MSSSEGQTVCRTTGQDFCLSESLSHWASVIASPTIALRHWNADKVRFKKGCVDLYCTCWHHARDAYTPVQRAWTIKEQPGRRFASYLIDCERCLAGHLSTIHYRAQAVTPCCTLNLFLMTPPMCSQTWASAAMARTPMDRREQRRLAPLHGAEVTSLKKIISDKVIRPWHPGRPTCAATKGVVLTLIVPLRIIPNLRKKPSENTVVTFPDAYWLCISVGFSAKFWRKRDETMSRSARTRNNWVILLSNSISFAKPLTISARRSLNWRKDAMRITKASTAWSQRLEVSEVYIITWFTVYLYP